MCNKVEEQIRNSNLDAAHLLKDAGAQASLQAMSNLVSKVTSQLASCAAVSDGFAKLELVEKLDKENNEAIKRLNELPDAAARTKAAASDFIAEIESDLKIIFDTTKSAADTNDAAVAKFQEQLKASNDFIHSNEAQQEAIWKKLEQEQQQKKQGGDGGEATDGSTKNIDDVQKQLQVLGVRRFEEVKKQIDMVQAESRRAAAYFAIREFSDNHRQRLELTKYNAEVKTRVGGLIAQLVQEQTDLAKTLHDNNRSELEKLRKTVM